MSSATPHAELLMEPGTREDLTIAEFAAVLIPDGVALQTGTGIGLGPTSWCKPELTDLAVIAECTWRCSPRASLLAVGQDH